MNKALDILDDMHIAIARDDQINPAVKAVLQSRIRLVVSELGFVQGELNELRTENEKLNRILDYEYADALAHGELSITERFQEEDA